MALAILSLYREWVLALKSSPSPSVGYLNDGYPIYDEDIHCSGRRHFLAHGHRVLMYIFDEVGLIFAVML